jgi:hypothetical protein
MASDPAHQWNVGDVVEMVYVTPITEPGPWRIVGITPWTAGSTLGPGGSVHAVHPVQLCALAHAATGKKRYQHEYGSNLRAAATLFDPAGAA